MKVNEEEINALSLPSKEKLKLNKQAISLKYSTYEAQQVSKILSPTSQKSLGHQSVRGKNLNSRARNTDGFTGYKHDKKA